MAHPRVQFLSNTTGLQDEVGASFSPLLIILSLALIGVGLSLPASGEPFTYASVSARIALESPPEWTVSGAWTADGTRLVLVDSLLSELRIYNTDGHLIGKPIKGLPGIDDFKPSYIQNVDGQLLLEYDTARFVWLSEDFDELGRFSLKNVPTAAGEIVSTFQWTALNSATLLTFSDVKEPGGRWSSKFLLIQLRPRITATTLDQVPIEDPTRPLYLLGQPFLTAVTSSTGAFLRLPSVNRQVQLLGLVQVDEGMPLVYKDLGLAVWEASRLPPLPLDNRTYSFKGIYSVFDAIESSVAGIYGWEGRLFTLIRHTPTWRAHQSPIWWLREVDLDDSGAYQEVPLLSLSAAHLTVIPGPSSWAFIEKGPVTGLAKQKVKGIRFVSMPALK